MSYPWPSFGRFQFQRSEYPAVDQENLGWRRAIVTREVVPPTESPFPILSVVQEAAPTRTVTVHLTRARYEELQELIGTTEEFVDFNRPVPTAYRAYLANVEATERVGYRSDGTELMVVTIELIRV